MTTLFGIIAGLLLLPSVLVGALWLVRCYTHPRAVSARMKRRAARSLERKRRQSTRSRS